ncbi:MAG: type II secretion system protein [Oscillospiraceae bacterium]|nr:type II secretion system protein [Oscillospiraceae bacterium]
MKKKHVLKGMTLVEVMVSLVILSVLVAMSSAMIIISMNLLLKNARMRDAQNNGNSIYEFIERKLEYAVSLKITNTDEKNEITGVYTEKIYIKDGVIALGCDPSDVSVPKDVLDKRTICSTQMLRGADYDISFSQGEEPEKIYLTVSIKRENEVVYERSGMIRFLNYEYCSDETVSNLEADTQMSGDMIISYSYFE